MVCVRMVCVRMVCACAWCVRARGVGVRVVWARAWETPTFTNLGFVLFLIFIWKTGLRIFKQHWTI